MGPSRNGEYLEIKNKILTIVHGAGHSELTCFTLLGFRSQIDERTHFCGQREEIICNKCCKDSDYIFCVKRNSIGKLQSGIPLKY